jgi:hypothetical protein
MVNLFRKKLSAFTIESILSGMAEIKVSFLIIFYLSKNGKNNNKLIFKDKAPHFLKGTLTQDFRPLVFFIKQLPLGP